MTEGWAHLETGQYERAIPLIQKASTMNAPPFVTAYLAFAQGMAGHRDAALERIAALEKLSPGGKVLPFNLALVYLGGDRSRAIDYFEKAYDANSQLLAWLGQDAMFDSLRSEPRFTALLRKLNFVKIDKHARHHPSSVARVGLLVGHWRDGPTAVRPDWMN